MRGLKKALVHLSADPVMAKLVAEFGVISYAPSRDQFGSLVYSIVEQQLSSKAAHTIHNRFLDLLPGRRVTPQNILGLSLEAIRSCGTSWAKARSLHDLSQKALDGTLRLESLYQLSDEEVIAHLVQVKGIGRWSAEMRLMFSLHRPDVLPLDDVGIQNAFVKLYGLSRKHKTLKKRMEKIASPWRPWRTVACWYLWRALDKE